MYFRSVGATVYEMLSGKPPLKDRVKNYEDSDLVKFVSPNNLSKEVFEFLKKIFVSDYWIKRQSIAALKEILWKQNGE